MPTPSPAAVAEKVMKAPEAKAPFVAPDAPGFMSWTEFCNRLAVELIVSDFGRQILGGTDDKPENIKKLVAESFASLALKCYRAVRMAHAIGAEKV